MTKAERAEVYEIRQAFDDALFRADKTFTEIKGESKNLNQAIKVMLHIKKRLKELSEGRIKRAGMD